MTLLLKNTDSRIAIHAIPYSHMSDADAELFYTTLNALIVYANQRLGVVDPTVLREREETPCMIYENGGRVADALWQNRWLVDDFVRENPLQLDPEHLDCARPWRHALRDMFTVVGADEHGAVYMNQDRLFAVGASLAPADAHVHHIPSLMLLTLLPFRGGIVTSGMTIHLSEKPAPWAVPLIAQQVSALYARPVVTTAQDLMTYASQIPDNENRVSPRFQREVDRGFATGEMS